MTNETQNSSVPLPSAMQEPRRPVPPGVPMPNISGQPKQAPATLPTNPLAQYFRHVNSLVQLPTKGRFWPEGTLELDQLGNLEVYPMTAKDEIMMKSPDGLLNGSSIIETVASCCPGIKDPWQMPGNDLDTILIAIRLASYGPDLEITTVCEHCNEQNDNMVDLRALLDNVPQGEIKNVVKVGELTLTLQPYDYRFINEINRNNFEEQRLIRGVTENSMSDAERTEYFENTFRKLAKHTIDSITTAVVKITMPDGTEVIDRNMITQFFQNCDRDTFNQTKGHIVAMSDNTQYPPFTIECDHCKKTYETTLQFNQTNFFA